MRCTFLLKILSFCRTSETTKIKCFSFASLIFFLVENIISSLLLGDELLKVRCYWSVSGPCWWAQVPSLLTAWCISCAIGCHQLSCQLVEFEGQRFVLLNLYFYSLNCMCYFLVLLDSLAPCMLIIISSFQVVTIEHCIIFSYILSLNCG